NELVFRVLSYAMMSWIGIKFLCRRDGVNGHAPGRSPARPPRQHRRRGEARRRRAPALARARQADQRLCRRLPAAPREGQGEARPRAGVHPLMRMSRERIFHLADLIVKELGATPGVHIKAPDDLRPEVVRALSEEAKLEESIDGEVRKILASYSRPMPE